MAKATEQTMKPITEKPAVAISLGDNDSALTSGSDLMDPSYFLDVRRSRERLALIQINWSLPPTECQALALSAQCSRRRPEFEASDKTP